MAKIFCNIKLNLNEEICWEAKNGATRRHLKVISKLGIETDTHAFLAQIGTLDKGNHSFIFLNEPKTDDTRILGLFLNSSYSYDVVQGKALFENHSSGGYGNSCSTFGIYELNSVLKVHTYKNRRSPSYFTLTTDGWQQIEAHEWEKDEALEL